MPCYCVVTPYVGVWIETFSERTLCPSNMSLLMWECGLKQTYGNSIIVPDTSLLMWECGLKLKQMEKAEVDVLVTPYVGVWIETEYHRW